MNESGDTRVEETKPVEMVKPEPTVKKITVVKQKDPKRIEMGKKLAAHNKKMKEQNSKLRETAQEVKAVGDAPSEYNCKYKWYAAAAVAGVVVSLYLFKIVVNKPLWSLFDNKPKMAEKPKPKFTSKPIETNSIIDME